jgi:hypothetical protein
VIVLLVLISAAVGRTVVRAADSALRVVIEAAEITGLVLVSAAGLAALAGMAVVIVRVRRRMLARPRPYRVTVLPSSVEAVPEAGSPELPARVVPALPRADVPAHSRIHVDPHVVTLRPGRPRRSCRRGGGPR